MKILNLLVLNLLLAVTLSGQILAPQNSWNYLMVKIPVCAKSTNCSGAFYTNINLIFGNDTLVDKTTYKILLQKTKTNYDPAYPVEKLGFLREDETHKKIFYRSNNISSSEMLIYDFTLAENDTFKLSNHQMKVVKRDSIMVDGHKKLRLKFDVVREFLFNPESTEDTLSWIEGVGSTQGLVQYYSYASGILICFRNNGKLLLGNKYNYDCSYTGPVDEVLIPQNTLLKVFPNPTHGLVNIETANNNSYTIKVFNSTGSLVKKAMLKGKSRLDFSSLPTGIYFVEVQYNNGQVQRTKLAKIN